MVVMKIGPFRPEHAEVYLELQRSAYSHAPAHTRPRDSSAFLKHVQGAASPGGVTRIATAHLNDRCVGSLAAMPVRFRTASGGIVIGYRIDYWVVDPAHQGKGIGRRLLEELTESLASEESAFVYSLPGQRSFDAFKSLGYVPVTSVPTFLYATGYPLRRIRKDRISAPILDRENGAWEAEFMNLEQVRDLFRDRRGKEEDLEIGFVRDPAFFSWRYLEPDPLRNYRYVVCRREKKEGFLVAVLAQHRLRGLGFTILVDWYSNPPSQGFPVAIQAARLEARRAKNFLVYTTTNAARLSRNPPVRGAPFGFSVPSRFNPRIVELVLYSKSRAIKKEDLAKSLVTTGDWMGF